MLGSELLESAMRRAFALASRSPAGDPNPQVGCVIVDPDGRIVAEGWHRGAGTPHAEVDALAHLPAPWRDPNHARELTAVVTLEPCNHTGRTGPCAEALARHSIGSVVYALPDPSPVAGGGADTLRAAGAVVRGGVLADEAREFLGPWLRAQSDAHGHGAGSPAAATSSEASAAIAARQPPAVSSAAQSSITQSSATHLHAARPFVTVKWAQTLDGRAAAADGSSRWITGPEARADVHRRRAEADAILVGTGTLLADDPELTARDEHGGLLVPAAEQPVPIVLGRRAIPANARILQHPALAAHRLESPLTFDGTDLAGLLADAHEMGVRRVFVEGGPTIASAFLAAGLADEVLVYIAPALLGGPHVAIGDLGVAGMAGIHRLTVERVEELGPDLLVVARIQKTSVTQEAQEPQTIEEAKESS